MRSFRSFPKHFLNRSAVAEAVSLASAKLLRALVHSFGVIRASSLLRGFAFGVAFVLSCAFALGNENAMKMGRELRGGSAAWAAEPARDSLSAEENGSGNSLLAGSSPGEIKIFANSADAESAEEKMQRERLERYRYDLRAIAADIYYVGKVTPKRAQDLAYVMVSESYRQGVPPSLVFGVMMIENPWFDSRAKSSAGARGLMQVMPFWPQYLGKKYGHDLTNDVTNVQMGIDILKQNLEKKDGDWRSALLAYNGCVRGTRTPDCFLYPDKVRKQVEKRARYSCPGGDFQQCVAVPVWYRFSKNS